MASHYHQQQPHFLDECYMCKRWLGGGRDIYMYKGDTPFCSVDCRDEQIQIDQAYERSTTRRRPSSSAVRKAAAAASSGSSSSSSPSSSSSRKQRVATVAVGVV